MTWFWYFLTYSFLGYLLERCFAWLTGSFGRRKCFLLMPLCPVYGLAMTAVLLLPSSLRQWHWILFTGGLVTTAVEYVFHWFCQICFHIRFWDYSAVPGNLHGRISLPFSIAWSFLTAFALYRIQPFLERFLPMIPAGITYAALLLLTFDAVCTAFLLGGIHDPDSLCLHNWNARKYSK